MSRLIARYRCSHLKITNSQAPLPKRRSLWTKLTSNHPTTPPSSASGDRGFLVDRDCDVCIASKLESERGTIYNRGGDEGDLRVLSWKEGQGGDEGKIRDLGEYDLGLQRLSHNDGVEFGLALASAVDVSESSELLTHDASSHSKRSSRVEVISKPQLWQLNLSPHPHIPPRTPSPTIWNIPSPPPPREAPPTAFPPSATLWKSPRGHLWYPRYQAPRPPSPVVWNYPPSPDVIATEYPEGIYFPPPPLTALWSPPEEEVSTWSSSSSSSSGYEYSGSDAASDEEHGEEDSFDLDRYPHLQTVSFEREEFERRSETNNPGPSPRKLARHRIWALLDEEGYDYAAEELSTRLQSYHSKAAMIQRHFMGSRSTPVLGSTAHPVLASSSSSSFTPTNSNHSPPPTPTTTTTTTSNHPTTARYRVRTPSPLRQELRVFRRQLWDADVVVPADGVGEWGEELERVLEDCWNGGWF